jgi:hypothetical protein
VGYRLAVGLVSALHLVVRRLRGQRAWTWADVEDDRGSFALRLYALVFPALLALSRVGGDPPVRRASTLVVAGRRR